MATLEGLPTAIVGFVAAQAIAGGTDEIQREVCGAIILDPPRERGPGKVLPFDWAFAKAVAYPVGDPGEP
jgi:hypothetical protein